MWKETVIMNTVVLVEVQIPSRNISTVYSVAKLFIVYKLTLDVSFAWLIYRSFRSSIRSGASFIASGIATLTRNSRLMNSIRNRASLHRSVPNGNSYQSSVENLIENVSNHSYVLPHNQWCYLLIAERSKWVQRSRTILIITELLS